MGCISSSSTNNGRSSEVKSYIESNPVMMFSKSYCPHCARAKSLLKKYNVQFEVVEMDVMTGGEELHAALKKYSRQNTVPNIYIGRKLIGGNDDLIKITRKGQLK